jgi:molecular chaperone DnaK (HSP70)
VKGRTLPLTLSRSKFVEINKEFFKKVSQLVTEVCMTETVDKIVLVGGSSRIPYILSIVSNIVGKGVPVCNSLDPDHTVSIGACVQLLMLNVFDNDNSGTILDVTNMTLGVETEGGIMTRIISKNTIIPVSKTVVFTNSNSHVDSITINVYQGERMFVKDNHLIGAFALEDLDKTLKSGEMHIHVKFTIDSNGIVNVTAKDSKTNNFRSISINKETIRNDKEDFEQILNDQHEYHLYKEKQHVYKTVIRSIQMFHATFPDITKQSFLSFRMNEIFNRVLEAIVNYNLFSPKDLNRIGKEFERAWHRAMLNSNPAFDNEVEIGSSKIDEC